MIAVGVASAVLGYALAYALFAEPLVGLFAGSGSGEWERGVIGDWGLHALCAGPLLIGLGSTFAAFAVLLDRLVKVPLPVRFVVIAVLALVAAFVAYFPIQVLLLVGAAF
jgi:hypothetical protein